MWILVTQGPSADDGGQTLCDSSIIREGNISVADIAGVDVELSAPVARAFRGLA